MSLCPNMSALGVLLLLFYPNKPILLGWMLMFGAGVANITHRLNVLLPTR